MMTVFGDLVEVLEEKFIPLPLPTSQVLYVLAWDRIRASTVTGHDPARVYLQGGGD